MKCIGTEGKDADLWVWIWLEVRRIHQEEILLEVEHVKAHRSKKKKQEVSLFERFVTEGKGRKSWQPTEHCCGWRRHGADQSQHSSAEESGGLRGFECAATFHCTVEEWHDCKERQLGTNEKWIFVDKAVEAKKHFTTRCAAASKKSLHEVWKKQ